VASANAPGSGSSRSRYKLIRHPCALITNGWFLPRDIDALAEAGLKRLLVSIDSAAMAEHERNRGLARLEQRLIEGIARARHFGIPVCASVTVSRLVNYEDLPATLRRLGLMPCHFPIRAATRSA
jgi:MoaA/NifB/PqqE/SkfB family radical SAM enzyme